MKKICELISSNNEEVELLLRLSDVVVKKTTSGDDYASMIGFDGIDKIEAKIWNFTEEYKSTLTSGDVYKVVARTKQYQNRTQINIEKRGKSKIKVIFLDIDGVLNSERYEASRAEACTDGANVPTESSGQIRTDTGLRKFISKKHLNYCK